MFMFQVVCVSLIVCNNIAAAVEDLPIIVSIITGLFNTLSAEVTSLISPLTIIIKTTAVIIFRVT